MGLLEEILEDRYDFIRREVKEPNELHIPERRANEFGKLIENSQPMLRADPFGETKHWWFMGMRVFNEIFSFGVGWSEETANIKQALKQT